MATNNPGAQFVKYATLDEKKLKEGSESMSAVEQYARAHIVTDEAADPPAVPVALRYDPEADPREVRITLPGHHEWVFARELLERGCGLRPAPVT